MLSAAIDDAVVAANSIAKLGRAFGLSQPEAARQESVKSKAMSPGQLIRLVSAAFTHGRQWSPLLLTIDRTVLPLGESFALQIGLHHDRDLGFLARGLTVARTSPRTGGASTPRKRATDTVTFPSGSATRSARTADQDLDLVQPTLRVRDNGGLG